jgi:hypothetical protein
MSTADAVVGSLTDSVSTRSPSMVMMPSLA